MKAKLLAFAIVIGLATSAQAGSTITYGKITEIRPVYTQVTNRQPVQVCNQVKVPVYGNNGQNNGNALLGAIIGAQKGSQSGNQNIVGYQYVNRCHTEYSNTSQSVINEYDLTYNVNGNIIKVRVNRAVGSNAYIGKRQKFRINYQIIN